MLKRFCLKFLSPFILLISFASAHSSMPSKPIFLAKNEPLFIFLLENTESADQSIPKTSPDFSWMHHPFKQNKKNVPFLTPSVIASPNEPTPDSAIPDNFGQNNPWAYNPRQTYLPWPGFRENSCSDSDGNSCVTIRTDTCYRMFNIPDYLKNFDLKINSNVGGTRYNGTLTDEIKDDQYPCIKFDRPMHWSHWARGGHNRGCFWPTNYYDNESNKYINIIINNGYPELTMHQACKGLLDDGYRFSRAFQLNENGLWSNVVGYPPQSLAQLENYIQWFRFYSIKVNVLRGALATAISQLENDVDIAFFPNTHIIQRYMLFDNAIKFRLHTEGSQAFDINNAYYSLDNSDTAVNLLGYSPADMVMPGPVALKRNEMYVALRHLQVMPDFSTAGVGFVGPMADAVTALSAGAATALNNIDNISGIWPESKTCRNVHLVSLITSPDVLYTFKNYLSNQEGLYNDSAEKSDCAAEFDETTDPTFAKRALCYWRTQASNSALNRTLYFHTLAMYANPTGNDATSIRILNREKELREAITGKEINLHGQPSGLFIRALSVNELVDGLSQIINVAFAKASGGGVSSSKPILENGVTKVFTTSFDDKWKATIEANVLSEDNNGVVTTSRSWTAKLPASDGTVDRGNRVIETVGLDSDINFSAATQAIAFKYETINSIPTQARMKALFGASETQQRDMINYLRGNDTPSQGGNWRQRSSMPGGTDIIGDVIGAEPKWVSKPPFNYPDSSYAAFKRRQQFRKPILVAGANDGMIHFFRGDGEKAGEEFYAFFPYGPMKPRTADETKSRLTKLANPTYQHEFFVDGQMAIADVQTSATDWATKVIGGYGAGGKGIYMFDVTDVVPDDNTKKPKFNFEIWGDGSGPSADLGYTFSHVSVVKMRNREASGPDYKWYAIFGNGYESKNRSTKLMLLDIDAIRTYSLRTSRPSAPADNDNSGLSSPVAVFKSEPGVADYIYAGDLEGNLWRWNVTQKGWANQIATKIFQAKGPETAGASNRAIDQPITATTEVIKTANNQQILLFGTGKYITRDDVEDKGIQSFYAIKNPEAITTTINPAQLCQQKIINQNAYANATVGNGANVRIISQQSEGNNACSRAQLAKGWFIDLVAGNTPDGERITDQVTMIGGRVFINTRVPGGKCSGGGSGFVYNFDLLTGDGPTTNVFDVNGDGKLDDSDKSDGFFVGGFQFENMPNSLNFISRRNGNPTAFTMDSAGNLISFTVAGQPSRNIEFRRQTWREFYGT